MPALTGGAVRTPAHSHLVRGRPRTGQEPYSLAMCLKEMGEQNRGTADRDRRHRILDPGTGEGEGGNFQPVRGAARIAEVQHPHQVFRSDRRRLADPTRMCARDGAIPAFQLVLHEFNHLGPFDLVFCRNVLIYFDQETNEPRARSHCPDHWSHDGYLVIGRRRDGGRASPESFKAATRSPRPSMRRARQPRPGSTSGRHCGWRPRADAAARQDIRGGDASDRVEPL